MGGIELGRRAMKTSSVSRKTVSLLIFAFWFVLIVALSTHLTKRKLTFKIPADEPSLIWQPDLYRVLTFGHWPAAVDSLLLQFLVEDNIKHVEEGVRARVYYYLDLATDLDPAFFSLYTAGANFLAVVRNDKMSALKIISKGENFRKNALSSYPKKFQDTYWTDAWRIPFIKGYIHLFEMNDLVGAAEAYRELTELPGVPGPIRDLSMRFGKPGGLYEVGMSVLKNMIAVSTDANVTRELEKKRNSLALSLDLFRMNEDFKPYRGNWARFKQERNIPDLDPWGGRMFLNPEGKIDSTTPRIMVLGIK